MGGQVQGDPAALADSVPAGAVHRQKSLPLTATRLPLIPRIRRLWVTCASAWSYAKFLPNPGAESSRRCAKDFTHPNGQVTGSAIQIACYD
jgi:hypothetical protein